MLGLSQAPYIDMILTNFNMADSKKELLPFRQACMHGVLLSKEQCAMTPHEGDHIRKTLYALVMGSLIYVMSCTWPDIYFSVRNINKLQSTLYPYIGR